jgi:hypothetical protein
MHSFSSGMIRRRKGRKGDRETGEKGRQREAKQIENEEKLRGV